MKPPTHASFREILNIGDIGKKFEDFERGLKITWMGNEMAEI